MIIVADLFKVQHEHVPVNASMLYIISRHYDKDEIHFYAEENHCRNVQQFLNSNALLTPNINWHSGKAFTQMGEGKGFLLKRIFTEAVSLSKLFRKLKQDKEGRLFMLYLSPLTSVFFKSFLLGSEKALITLHGDLEFIKLDSSSMRNFLGRCFRISFRKKRSGCKYLALEDVIKMNLVQSGLLNDDEVVAVAHPYIFINDLVQQPVIKSPLTIGYIGVASVEKNAAALFSMAAAFTDDIKKRSLEFVLIGKNENIPEEQLNDLVKAGRNKAMLDRKNFEGQIQSVHYAVFFHDNNAYQFTSSGSVYDAFNFEKPIIALRTDLFQSFFERAGKIGFLCNDMDEMKTVVRNILNGSITALEYATMQLNMRRFKAAHTLDNVRQSLFSQLGDW